MRTQGAEETISPAPCGYFCRLKLHYSQTQMDVLSSYLLFNYHLKLHYSQTSNHKLHIADRYGPLI